MGAETSKNILLVYPETPQNSLWSFSYSLPFIGKYTSMFPLGLATVAPIIQERGHNVRIIDMNVNPLTDEDIRKADIILTSSMNSQDQSLEQIIARANRSCTPVGVSGPFPTQYYDSPTMLGADYFILGEAESGVLEAFLEDFEAGKPKRAYARVPIRTRPGEREIDELKLEQLLEHFGNDQDIQKATRPAMSSSPTPAYELVDMEAYASASIQTTRGCPFDCDFCSVIALNGHGRTKSSGQVIEELDTLYNTGYRGAVFIVDDNFLANRRKAKKILSEIIDYQIERDYPFNFCTQVDIGLSKDEELMELMRDAGFDMAFIGFESPDEEVLRNIGKEQNMRINLVDAVRKIQSYGMEVTAALMVGTDNDPPDICDKIFDFCQEAGIPTAMVGLLTALRESKLHEQLKQEGRLLEDTFSGNNTHQYRLNFIPQQAVDIALERGIDTTVENGRIIDPKYQEIVDRVTKRIVRNYEILLDRLYDGGGGNYFKRCRTFMDNCGERPKPSRSIGLTEVKAFARSITSQTFLRHYSGEHRRFLRYAFSKHREKFPEAVTMAIKGHHLMKITRDSLEANLDYTPWQLHRHLRDELRRFSERLEDGYDGVTATYRGGIELLDEARQLGEDTHKNLRREANTFLEQARARLEILPKSYRRKLSGAYRKLEQSVAIVAPQLVVGK